MRIAAVCIQKEVHTPHKYQLPDALQSMCPLNKCRDRLDSYNTYGCGGMLEHVLSMAACVCFTAHAPKSSGALERTEPAPMW